MFLAHCYRDALIHLRAVAHVTLGDDARAVGRVEDIELGVVGEERPNAVVVHGKCVHAPSSCHGPYFDRLVGRGGEDGITILGYQHVSDIVRVADKLGYALARPRVPDAHDAFGSTACDYGWTGSEGVDGALGNILVVADCDLELLACTVEVPQADLVVQAARGDPVLVWAGRGHALDVVGVEADGLRRLDVCGSWSPELDGDVGGGGHEGLGILDENEVVDPVGVCLDLLAEAGGRRLVVGGARVGEGVSFVVVAVSQVEVQVPGAYDAVAASRVAVRRQS